MPRWLAGLSACLLIAVAMVSCRLDSYPGLIYDKQVDINNNETENPVAVQLYLERQRFFEVNPVRGTRGLGPMEDEVAEDGSIRPVEFEQMFTFHVFAFLNDGDFGPADLRYSFFSDQGTGGRDERHNQCLIDGYDYDGPGLGAKLNTDQSKELIFQYDDELCPDEPNRLYYSGSTDDELRRGYNFFVYHTDDSKITTARAADRIVHSIEIDGTQDIMAGASPVLDDAYINARFPEVKRALSESEMAMVRNIRGFSSYTARRGIYPIVQLEHKLARLRFFVYPGTLDNGVTTCAGVLIDSVTLNVPNKGEFTVAGRVPEDMGIVWKDNKIVKTVQTGIDVVEYTEGTDMYLLREDGRDDLTEEQLANPRLLVGDTAEDGKAETGVGWLEWNSDWNTMPWKDRPCKSLGRDLLIPPVDECAMTIYYHIEDEWTSSGDSPDQVRARKMFYKLPPSDVNTTFEAGKVYNINIAIFGPQKIEVNGYLSNWTYGGNVNVGGD